MSLQSSWVWRGYFDLSGEDPRNNTTEKIRQELCRGLGLAPGAMRRAGFPVGPAWRRVFWWREGNTDFAEAQFFMRIVREHAVLSLGVSVEKGYETSDMDPTDPQKMDRTSWEWQRLLTTTAEILTIDVPAVVAALGMPVTLRLRSSARQGVVFENDSRAFSFVDGAWFERNHGSSAPEEIAAYIMAADARQDRWGIAFFGADFAPAAVDQMEPAQAARLLLAFEPIRQRLRGNANASSGAA